MKNRRQFIRTAGCYGVSAIFLSQLLACKSKTPEIVEVEKAVKKELKKLNLPDGASFKMNYLNGNVGYFSERGGTIGWFVEKDHIVVVDTQFPEQSQNLVDQIKTMTDAKMDLLINTHHHGDHTAGNIIYKDLTNRILAHENSKKNQMASAIKRGNENTQLYPNETFTDQHSEEVGSERISLSYHGAAHTDGDAIIHFENANVVHMGDLVFNRRFPYIDKSAGANIENWIKVLDASVNKFDNDAKFIFGHAGDGYDVIGGKEDIKAFRNYLESLLSFGQKSIAEGMTLEDAKSQIKEIPGAPEWKGSGIERSLVAVYDELGEG